MYTYIIRRLGFGALTVLGVSIVVFLVLRVLPGDPLVAIFGAGGLTKLSEPTAPAIWRSSGSATR